ncbi:MAG TPA: hypothetical protein VFY05_07165 [Candidatus Angelobacter sp.]|nr:hypothetical protein [Candidatus Angelobacter sp.]
MDSIFSEQIAGFLNLVMSKMGAKYGEGPTVSAGTALRLYPALRGDYHGSRLIPR